jgi:precorrin-6A synthase
MNDIEKTRAEAKARKGWIMDTYLLRRRDAEEETN